MDLTVQNLERNDAYLRLKKTTDLSSARITQVFSTDGFTFAGPAKAPKMFILNPSVNPADDEVLTYGQLKKLGLVGGGGSTTIITQPIPNPQASSTIVEATNYLVGGVYDERAIIAAIAILPSTGGTVHIAAAQWHINNEVAITKPGVILWGDGAGTNLLIDTSITRAFHIQAPGCSFQQLLIDGQWTSTAKLSYQLNDFGGDPANSVLLNGSPILIGPGGDGFSAYKLEIKRHRGYACYIDCTTAIIDGVYFEQCVIHDYVQYTFVWDSGQKADGSEIGYGCWSGGLHAQGAGALYHVRNFTVDNCNFYNMNGTCVWTHSYSPSLSNNNLHEFLTWTGNVFDYIGLDCLLVQAAENVLVSGNTGNHVGYIGTTPKYLLQAAAVGVDTGGYVRNARYLGNSFKNVNGTGLDLDGLADSLVADNSVWVAKPTDSEWGPASTASYGFGTGADIGNATKGIQTNNSYDPRGAKNVVIFHNKLYGCGINSIVLFDCENCTCTNNVINHSTTSDGVPASRAGVPIEIKKSDAMSSWPAPYTNQPGVSIHNSVFGNIISYNGANVCIYEDGNIVGPNYIWGNTAIGTNYGEFKRANASSVSLSRFMLSTNDSTATYDSQSILQREGFGASGAFKHYTKINGVGTQNMSLSDAGLLNISINGGANTGVITTGDRVTAGIPDIMATRAIFLDEPSGAATITPTANSGVVILKVDASTHKAMISENGGAFTQLLGSGSISGLQVGEIPYATAATAIAGTPNLTWTNATRVFTVNGAPVSLPGTPATAAIVVTSGYIQSAYGFFSDYAQPDAIHLSAGGAKVQTLIAQSTAFQAIQTPGNVQCGSIQTLGSVYNTIDTVLGTGAQGGTNADWGGIYTWQLSLKGRTDVPPVAGAGTAKIYLDTSVTPPVVKASLSTGAFAAFGSGGSVAGLTAGRIPFAVNATTLADTANLLWNNANKYLYINGLNTVAPFTAGIAVDNAYIQSGQGFFCGTADIVAFNAPNGSIVCAKAAFTSTDSVAAVSVSGGLQAVNLAATGIVYNTIQAVGSVNSGLRTYTITLEGRGTPGASATNQAVMYCNGGSVLISVNGGTYQALLTAGNSVSALNIWNTATQSYVSMSGSLTISYGTGVSVTRLSSQQIMITSDQINSAGAFVGAGVLCPLYGGSFLGLTVGDGGVSVSGANGISGSIYFAGGFSYQSGGPFHQIHVTGGVITSIT